MVKTLLVLVLVFCALVSAGCGKKKAPADEYQAAISIEELSAMKPSVPPAKEAKPAAPAELLPLPPQGPYKPGAEDIQKALQNAGFYTGKIDGKIGPLSEKAIKEFQKANGLEADGKVGPKTWELLSKYLEKAPGL